MQLDIQDLRRHYESLSDDALLDIDRDELVEMAQSCYDGELQRRGLHSREVTADGEEVGDAIPESGPEPDWLEDAACATSFTAYPGRNAAPDAEKAREVLEASGIPCYVMVQPADKSLPQPSYEYQVLVPGAFNLEAISVLDKEIFNAQLEEEWRTHFAALSDEDFKGLSLETLVAGLHDRVERLTRAYHEELVHRGFEQPELEETKGEE